MSFVLPGNARSLRFTGEAKALDLPPPPTTNRGATGVALGKPRVRKPSGPPPPRLNTPTPASPYGESPRYLGSINPPVIRHNETDSDNATYAMVDREGFDVLPGGGALRAPGPNFPIPVPNFRPAHEIQQQQQQQQQHFLNQPPLEAPQGGGAPWAVWLLASIVMGVLMYFAAPAMLLTPTTHPQAQAAPIVSTP